MTDSHEHDDKVNDQDDDLVRLNKRGRRDLRAPDGLQAPYLLCLEILARIGGWVRRKDVVDMTDALIAYFGSAEAALTAVKCGEVVDFLKLRHGAALPTRRRR